MLKLHSHHSRSGISFHVEIHYYFIFNHLLFTNFVYIFVQAVKFATWVKPQEISSPESMNTYRKTPSATSLNI